MIFEGRRKVKTTLFAAEVQNFMIIKKLYKQNYVFFVTGM